MIRPVSTSTNLSQLQNDGAKGNAFRLKLEKHIRDHKSGEGHSSREMYKEVDKSQKENNEILKGTQASILYSGYSTLFTSYDKKARMNTHLNSALKETQKILNAPEEDKNTI